MSINLAECREGLLTFVLVFSLVKVASYIVVIVSKIQFKGQYLLLEKKSLRCPDIQTDT